MMRGETVIADSLRGLDATHLDEVTSGRPPALAALLAAVEATADPACRSFYALRYEAGEPAAGAVGRAGDHAPEKLLRLLTGRAPFVSAAIGPVLGPVLDIGPVFGASAGLAVRPGLEKETQAAALDRLCADIEAHADARRLTIVVSNVLGDDGAVIRTLRRRGYLWTLGLPAATMDVTWTDWSGYLAMIRNRRRKSWHTIRRERRLFEESGLEVRWLDDLGEREEAVERLIRDHHLRLNGLEWPLPRGLLREFCGKGGGSRVCLVLDGERPVAAVLFVIHGSTGWATAIGILEESRVRRAFTYFNLAYYLVVEAAAELGLSRLLYGNGAYEAKRLRGCAIQPTHFFFRPRSPAARPLLAGWLAFHRRWFLRKYRTHLS